jgi:2-hydroxy-6-oxonona-2,4-dienedioate hydrolase
MKTLVAAYRDPSVESMTHLTQVMTYDSARFATPELAAERAANALAHPKHLTNYLDAFANGGPVAKWFKHENLGSIQAPSLLIHGRDDRVVHYENTLLLLAHIPNARAVLLNRCGHWAQVEHAEEFNRLVIEFVSNN